MKNNTLKKSILIVLVLAILGINAYVKYADKGKGTLSDEQALSAVKAYCYAQNADLEDIEKEGKYPVYWEVSSSEENEIVILFRSYTGAQIRFYIDRVTGDTYSTEFAPGISFEEERTDESFDVRDYLDEDII